ncbi:hypothetical protein LCGC14_1058500 [marine sediment metagenome]|uniref:Uncharacterized protein n=1 Tax=marine sediment metagenome TaxID=412755 RepID=A0A0F9MRH8_9ZZZZ
MAGVAKVKINVKITGLGDDVEVNPDFDAVTMTVPVETASGYVIVAAATTTALQLSDLAPQIALAKMYGLYVKSKVGTIYIQVDTAGTTTFGSAAAHITLNVGEPCYIPINPSGNLGVAFDAAAVTDAFEWLLLGQA